MFCLSNDVCLFLWCFSGLALADSATQAQTQGPNSLTEPPNDSSAAIQAYKRKLAKPQASKMHKLAHKCGVVTKL